MKVLIDATPLLLQSAGVKGHLFEWIRAMRELAPPGTVHTWPALDPCRALDHTRTQASRLQTMIGLGAFLASHKLGLPVWDTVLPQADVFHACIMQGDIPRRMRVTATVFDMTPMLMPDAHTQANVRSFRNHAERVLKRAHRLNAISEHSRQDAIRLLGLDPGRIVIIPPIISADYHNVTDAQARAACSAFHLEKPFVLFVGTIEPRKNIDRLLDAWQQLPPRYREQFDLVFAGSAGWRSEQTVARLQSGTTGARWLGYVAETHMPGLSRAATVLAYTSLYEGFGLPAAQALAAGTPVITSNVSSMPEVVGPGGLLVDPLSPSEIATGLARLLDDPDLRAGLVSHGRAYVLDRFGPEPVGRASLAFFEQACG